MSLQTTCYKKNVSPQLCFDQNIGFRLTKTLKKFMYVFQILVCNFYEITIIVVLELLMVINIRK